MNWGIYVISVFVSLLGLVWFVFWLYATNGISRSMQYCEEADYGCSSSGILIGLVFSLYWTSIVLMNSTQTTVAGVISTWCFDKENASTCCSEGVTSSLFRTFTYSLGSICFGSLINAIVLTLRYVLDMAERNRDDENIACSILYCVLQCILILIQDIIEYFNQWAYVFVGMYGMSYLESGKAVWELFQARGLTAIVSDDLTHFVLGMVTFISGIGSGCLGMIIVAFVGNDYFYSSNDYDGSIHAFWISFLVGIVSSSITMNVIQGAVKTIIVCYADNPRALSENHPEDVRKMSEAWLKVYPEVAFCSNVV